MHRVIALHVVVAAVGAALGVFYPFISVILSDRGFGPAEIGLVSSIGAIGFTIAVPAWGHLADVRLGRPRTLFVTGILGGLAIALLLGPWPPLVIAILFWLFWIFESPWQPLADAVTVNAVGRDYARVRLLTSLSFALVVTLGFLLMVSLTVSAGLAAFGAWLGRRAPGIPTLLAFANTFVSLVVLTALFTLLYRVLPDVKLRWRDVVIGGITTAVLFTIGKVLIGLYLGRSAVTSSYGAIGSVLVLLVWVYYSAQILLLGAEFTRVYTERNKGRPEPEEFAEKDNAALARAVKPSQGLGSRD